MKSVLYLIACMLLLTAWAYYERSAEYPRSATDVTLPIR